MAHRFRVEFPPPLDLGESLEMFRRSGDDLIDRWDGARLLRTSKIGRRVIAWRGEPAGDASEPVLNVESAEALTPAEEVAARAAIRATFVETPPAWTDLVARDPVIAALNARFPALRPALEPDLLTGLIRGISAQQVNLRWAATTRRRLAEAFGEPHRIAGDVVYSLSAERLAAAPVEAIRALQFTTTKARSIVAVATALADGTFDEAALAAAPDDVVIERLTALRGIGLWSAEWTLARTYGRPRVVGGDLGVRKAVGRLYLGVPIASDTEVRRATADWGEAATVAQTLALRTLVR